LADEEALEPLENIPEDKLDLTILTRGERRVWLARKRGRSWEQIAGANTNAARSRWKNARQKLEKAYLKEERKAEQEATLLAELTNPERRTLAEIATEAGVHPSTTSRMASKLDREYVNLQVAEKDFQKGKLKLLYGHTAQRILENVTQEDIENASLRDKLVAAAVATDKHLLLDGQPTEILSVKEMSGLDELAKMLVQEIARRGQSIETQGTMPKTAVLGEQSLDRIADRKLLDRTP
jgi:hypothetical protein